ncbi:MAG: hypothetical protein MZV70_37870 [Desulfobacterales bacterium]|nr:hypothetical protein [Desulfobacterales bacterium]
MAVRIQDRLRNSPAAPPPARRACSARRPSERLGRDVLRPARPKKYWSSPTRQHDSYREAVFALAADFDHPVEWVEQHMIDSNDLMEIRRHLEEQACGRG